MYNQILIEQLYKSLLADVIVADGENKGTPQPGKGNKTGYKYTKDRNSLDNPNHPNQDGRRPGSDEMSKAKYGIKNMFRTSRKGIDIPQNKSNEGNSNNSQQQKIGSKDSYNCLNNLNFDYNLPTRAIDKTLVNLELSGKAQWSKFWILGLSLLSLQTNTKMYDEMDKAIEENLRKITPEQKEIAVFNSFYNRNKEFKELVDTIIHTDTYSSKLLSEKNTTNEETNKQTDDKNKQSQTTQASTIVNKLHATLADDTQDKDKPDDVEKSVIAILKMIYILSKSKMFLKNVSIGGNNTAQEALANATDSENNTLIKDVKYTIFGKPEQQTASTASSIISSLYYGLFANLGFGREIPKDEKRFREQFSAFCQSIDSFTNNIKNNKDVKDYMNHNVIPEMKYLIKNGSMADIRRFFATNYKLLSVAIAEGSSEKHGERQNNINKFSSIVNQIFALKDFELPNEITMSSHVFDINNKSKEYADITISVRPIKNVDVSLAIDIGQKENIKLEIDNKKKGKVETGVSDTEGYIFIPKEYLASIIQKQSLLNQKNKETEKEVQLIVFFYLPQSGKSSLNSSHILSDVMENIDYNESNKFIEKLIIKDTTKNKQEENKQEEKQQEEKEQQQISNINEAVKRQIASSLDTYKTGIKIILDSGYDVDKLKKEAGIWRALQQINNSYGGRDSDIREIGKDDIYFLINTEDNDTIKNSNEDIKNINKAINNNKVTITNTSKIQYILETIEKYAKLRPGYGMVNLIYYRNKHYYVVSIRNGTKITKYAFFLGKASKRCPEYPQDVNECNKVDIDNAINGLVKIFFENQRIESSKANDVMRNLIDGIKIDLKVKED